MRPARSALLLLSLGCSTPSDAPLGHRPEPEVSQCCGSGSYWSVTRLPVPAGYAESRAQVINDAGQIAGTARRADFGHIVLRWTGTQVADLQIPPCETVEVVDINQSGQILASGCPNPVLWSPTNGYVTLPVAVGGEWVKPVGLTESGEAWGVRWETNTTQVVWSWSPAAGVRVWNSVCSLTDIGDNLRLLGNCSTSGGYGWIAPVSARLGALTHSLRGSTGATPNAVAMNAAQSLVVGNVTMGSETYMAAWWPIPGVVITPQVFINLYGTFHAVNGLKAVGEANAFGPFITRFTTPLGSHPMTALPLPSGATRGVAVDLDACKTVVGRTYDAFDISAVRWRWIGTGCF